MDAFAKGVGRGTRVQIFVDETDRVGDRPLSTAILERLIAEGASGATVIRCVAGFGAHGRLRAASAIDPEPLLPLVITWIDAPDRVERVLPSVRALAPASLITIETVEIAAYPHRDLTTLHTALVVADVMTRQVVTVPTDATVSAIVDRLAGQSFRSLPVLDERGRVVGIITNTDLTERGGLPIRIELITAMDPAIRRRAFMEPRPRRAVDIMTRSPIVASPETPLADVVERMVKHAIKRLPVADADGTLVGIISRTDVLRAFGQGFPAPTSDGDAAAGEGGAAGGQAMVARGRIGAARTVGEIMTRHVPVARLDAALAEVLDVVISTRLNRAVVIDEAGRVRGVVSDADVLRGLEAPARASVLPTLMGQVRSVPAEAARRTAAELMTTTVCAPAEMPIDEAARVMLGGRYKVLPVVDEQGGLLGIVDRAHLLWSAHHHA
ncbi:MAG: DUF190 domain-containing protein [Chloroflexi bacterium]|nr:DUF190 domain-containing protein [Chloroflexota bacterium]